MMKLNIQLHNGVPSIFLDGEAVTGLMHWTRTPTPEDIILFKDAGINFFSFMGNLSIKPSNPVPDSDLEILDGGLPRMLLTTENIDQTMSMLISANPQIKVLPRIIMNPPVWWEKQHQNELMLYYDCNKRDYVRGPRASLGSSLWTACWTKALKETVMYFEEKWSDYIIGYHTGLGHCGEHTYWWWDHIAEFSKGHQNAYLLWLQQKYKSIKCLNKAWNSNWADWQDIPLPDAARLVNYGPRAASFLLPESETDLIDFQLFSSDLMAETLLLEAKTVKTTLHELDRKKLYGAFYGYINLVANSTQTTVGHSALNKVLNSPDIDFICGPLSYGARQNGGTILPQMITSSIRLHDKVFYNEDDTGTHVVNRSHHGYIPATAEASIHAERRNFLETLRTGGAQWWMDLYGVGWFRDKQLQQEFNFLRTFADSHFDKRDSHAEIAVFVSLESMLYMRDNPVPLTGNLIEHQLFEIASCGSSYDLFQDQDIPLLAEKGKLKQYRLCIFLNSLVVPETLQCAIKKHLQCDDRTLLWIYAPGYICGNSRNAKHSENLTGIRFHAVETGIMPLLTETWLGEQRISYGLTRAVYPRLTADDPDAASLGYYVNGTTIVSRENGDGSALATKQMSDWRSIWSSSPGVPSILITQWAKQAGVHIFSERGDQIFFGGDWLGIHSKCDGPLTLTLPEQFQVNNAIDGSLLNANTDVLTLSLTRGETILLNLSK